MPTVAQQFDRYCIACRHSLRGLESRQCPECGRAFDPNDLRSTARHAAIAGWNSIASAARLLTWVGAAVAGLVLILSAIGRMWGFDPWFALFLFTSPIWLAMMITSFVVALLPGAPLRMRLRVTALLVLPFVVSIVLTNWPFRLSFLAHRPRLNAIAQDAQAGKTLPVPMQVGLFSVQEISVDLRGAVILQISGNSAGGNHLVKSEQSVATLRSQNWWRRILDDEWSTYYED